MRNILMFSSLLTLALSLQQRLNAATEYIYVPFAIGGNSPTAGPFGNLQPLRLQQVYSASAFSAIQPGGGWITQIGFSGADTPQGSGNAILANLQIDLSTTSRGPDGLSTVFSANVGPDEMVVLGPTGVIGYSWTQGGYTFLTLDHPFFYNPVGGNLLLDVRNYGEIPPFSTSFLLDGQSQLGDSISSVGSSPDVNSSTGIAFTGGALTEFTVVGVPEPSMVALSGLGTFGLLGAAHMHRTKNKQKGRT